MNAIEKKKAKELLDAIEHVKRQCVDKSGLNVILECLAKAQFRVRELEGESVANRRVFRDSDFPLLFS